jgi:predicted lysophospholipase L1 biosynthesis ABC-type transport system permease subunit
MLLLLAGTSFLFLLAVVQVTGLMLTSLLARMREIGTRIALGATAGTLTRLLGGEGIALSAAALILGWAATEPLVHAIVRVLPPDITVGQVLAADRRAFLYASLCTVVALTALASLPMTLIRSVSAAELLRSGSTIAGGYRSRVQTLLLVSQLTFVTLLLYLTILAGHSAWKLSETDLGFAGEDLVAIRMPRGDLMLAGSTKERLDRQRTRIAETADALARLRGVRGVSGAHFWPMESQGLQPRSIRPDADPGATPISGNYAVIALGFPGVVGTPLVEGEEPSEATLRALGTQLERGEQQALVNSTLARRLAVFGPAVGQLLDRRFRVVGVIEDAKFESPDAPAQPTIFHYLPPPAAPSVLLVRLERGRSAADVGIPATLAGLWGDDRPRWFPVTDAIVAASATQRTRTMLLALVAALSLPLSALGIVGSLMFSIRQRARDIGIQLALGAEPGSVGIRIVQQALSAAAIAVTVGIAGGMAVGTLAESTLYGVLGIDAMSGLLAAGFVMLFVGVAATLPARYASRIEACQLLRES